MNYEMDRSLSQLKADTAQLRADAKDAATEAATQARDYAKDASEKAVKAAKALPGSIDQVVRDNPWLALGVAVLVGWVLGSKGSRRSD